MLKSGLLLFAMLTALLASAVYVPGAYCQDAGSVRVLVRPDPESPYAGSEWTLTLAIDHPVPYEVSVIPPSFPSALFLDRVLKNSRLITETGATRRWTIAEYRFIPESAGTYTIDPFVIIVPQGSVTTEKITVTVRDVNNQGIAQRQALVWDSPAHLSPGETAIVFLKMSGPGAAVPAGLVPAPEIFMPPLQDNFIIEENGQDAGNPAVVLKLKIIPLAVQNLNLPARTVTYENIRFDIPALSIRGIPRAESGVSEKPAVTSAPESRRPAPPPGKFVFPAYGVAGFWAFKASASVAEYETVYRTAENLCGRAYYAEALALLRQKERDSIYPVFGQLRKQVENELGIFNTRSEKPFTLVYNAWLVLCGVLFLLFILFFVRRKGRKGMIIVCVLFVLAGAAILVYRQSGSSAPGSPYPGVYKSAVVKGGETRGDFRAELRRIPDLSGEVQAVLREGQPVRALEISGNDRNTRNAASADTRWVWVITNDAQKISGWIPESRLVYY